MSSGILVHGVDTFGHARLHYSVSLLRQVTHSSVSFLRQVTHYHRHRGPDAGEDEWSLFDDSDSE